MNFNWSDAQNLLDILDHFWIGLVALGVTAIPSWFAHRNHQSIRDIKNQVVNGHSVPLRADLDRALAAIEALAHDVNALRHDLITERDSRKHQIDDLRSDVDRMRRR